METRVSRRRSSRRGRVTEADEPEAVPAVSFQATFLFDGTLLEDGSLVLIGQTGVYNKFGQGPSKLWLLRIDGDGKRLGQAFIDGGRVFPSVRDLIAHCDGGVIASYTTDQSVPIAGRRLSSSASTRDEDQPSSARKHHLQAFLHYMVLRS